MDRQKSAEGGYILLELLLVLMVMAALEVMFLPRIREPKLNSYNFMNDYLLDQTIALRKGETKVMDTGIYGVGAVISFNGNGNVNQARTVDIEGRRLVITLGTGRIHE